jgi:energy-coupling factor transport system ATP-binding protein
MILDEPTAGQDYRVYTEIMTFLETLNKEYGITILFITHDMHLAIEYTDRAIVFSEGGCIGDDSVFKILSDGDIIQRAHLKETSLFTLAKRLDLPCDEFTEHFISYERMNRHE